jgi:hypothetical protein
MEYRVGSRFKVRLYSGHFVTANINAIKAQSRRTPLVGRFTSSIQEAASGKQRPHALNEGTRTVGLNSTCLMPSMGANFPIASP